MEELHTGVGPEVCDRATSDLTGARGTREPSAAGGTRKPSGAVRKKAQYGTEGVMSQGGAWRLKLEPGDPLSNVEQVTGRSKAQSRSEE